MSTALAAAANAASAGGAPSIAATTTSIPTPTSTATAIPITTTPPVAVTTTVVTKGADAKTEEIDEVIVDQAIPSNESIIIAAPPPLLVVSNTSNTTLVNIVPSAEESNNQYSTEPIAAERDGTALEEGVDENMVVYTTPRPDTGYRYTMEFLYSIGREMAGITLNMTAPMAITPSAARALQPLMYGHLSMLPGTALVGTSASSDGMGERALGGGQMTPQFLYSGYVPSAPQRRLWHTDNAVWQFDCNYPFNQSYHTQQYGMPIMPMGFEPTYCPQRMIYPGYYGAATHTQSGRSHRGTPRQPSSAVNSASSSTTAFPTSSSCPQSTSSPTQASATSISEHSEMKSSIEPFDQKTMHNQAGPGQGQGGSTWRHGRGNRNRYAAARDNSNSSSFLRESKSFYNSSAVVGGVTGVCTIVNHQKFKSNERRNNRQQQQHQNYQEQQQQQTSSAPASSSIGAGGSYNAPKRAKRFKQQQTINANANATVSNSPCALSTSSSKTQFTDTYNSGSTSGQLKQGGPALTNTPSRHSQRSYRNRSRYSEPLPSHPSQSAQSTTTTNQWASSGQRGNKYSDQRGNSHYQQMSSQQPSSQVTRYYHSNATAESNYGQYLCFPESQSLSSAMAEGTSGGGRALCAEHLPIDINLEYSDFASIATPMQKHQAGSRVSGNSVGGDFDDSQSFVSLAPSSISDSCDSELSDASVESMARKITADLLANATGMMAPELNGPNLVPYGDMYYLKEHERREKQSLKNGYQHTATLAVGGSERCCGDMLKVPSLWPNHKTIEGVENDDDGDDETDRSPTRASGNPVIVQEPPVPLALYDKFWHEFFGFTPADRFMLRTHLVELRRPPRTLPSRTKWEPLAQSIWEKFQEAQQTRAAYKIKMRLWRFIYTVTMATYPRYGVYLVGSTISYFGSKCSDMDICILACTNPTIDPRMEAVYNLQSMRELLKSTNVFQDFNLIEARVPILRFTDCKNKVEVDINFNNSVGIRNTHLLYCYSQLEWRVRPMAVTVKQWAQYHNINNAKNMTISSYSLILMVIHFLQAGVSPPVLPCLHKMYPKKFDLMLPCEFGFVDMNEVMDPYQSDNNQTLGELLLCFLHYYSVFEYSKFAISIRVGGVLPVEVCRASKAPKNDIHQWNELCIEEPFDQTNTARSVYDPEIFERVKAIFFASYKRLESTRNLNSIFENYDGPTISVPETTTTTTTSSEDQLTQVSAPWTNNIADRPEIQYQTATKSGDITQQQHQQSQVSDGTATTSITTTTTTTIITTPQPPTIK